jgi:hypothetical protein
VDKAVKIGEVKPGQYLILGFDFSRPLPSELDKSTKSLQREIARGLLRFKCDYAKALGQYFLSATSDFVENDPGANLTCLVEAVDCVLQDIHDRGQEDHALWDVQGVCLF